MPDRLDPPRPRKNPPEPPQPHPQPIESGHDTALISPTKLRQLVEEFPQRQNAADERDEDAGIVELVRPRLPVSERPGRRSDSPRDNRPQEELPTRLVSLRGTSIPSKAFPGEKVELPTADEVARQRTNARAAKQEPLPNLPPPLAAKSREPEAMEDPHETAIKALGNMNACLERALRKNSAGRRADLETVARALAKRDFAYDLVDPRALEMIVPNFYRHLQALIKAEPELATDPNYAPIRDLCDYGVTQLKDNGWYVDQEEMLPPAVQRSISAIELEQEPVTPPPRESAAPAPEPTRLPPSIIDPTNERVWTKKELAATFSDSDAAVDLPPLPKVHLAPPPRPVEIHIRPRKEVDSEAEALERQAARLVADIRELDLALRKALKGDLSIGINAIEDLVYRILPALGTFQGEYIGADLLGIERGLIGLRAIGFTQNPARINNLLLMLEPSLARARQSEIARLAAIDKDPSATGHLNLQEAAERPEQVTARLTAALNRLMELFRQPNGITNFNTDAIIQIGRVVQEGINYLNPRMVDDIIGQNAAEIIRQLKETGEEVNGYERQFNLSGRQSEQDFVGQFRRIIAYLINAIEQNSSYLQPQLPVSAPAPALTGIRRILKRLRGKKE